MRRVRGRQVCVPDLLDTVVSAAKRSKFDEFDAYAVHKNARQVSLERGSVSGADSITSTSLHIRVCVDGRVGGAFCNKTDRAGIKNCLEQAAKIARLRDSDKNWRGFPSTEGRYPSVQRLYDKSVASLDIEVMSMMAEEMIDGALSVSKDVSAPYGTVEAKERVVGIVNSSGINVTMEETELEALICCVAGSGESISPDCEESGKSRGCDLRPEKIGERAAWVAEKSTNIVDAKTEECDVVFSPMSLGVFESGLLSVVLSKALSGQNVLQRITFLADKVGEQIWSDQVTISDNPLLSGKCGSRPFDDEGFPTAKTRLVSKGVLEGYMWDSYHGSLSGECPTGNAVRDLVTGAVSVGPLCLQMSKGTGSMSSIIESVDHGYLVWGCQGAHTSNTETGGFSFVASPGLLIEKGEVIGGVQGAMVSGNISSLMRNVERVGSDVVDFGNSLMPSVLFNKVKMTTG